MIAGPGDEDEGSDVPVGGGGEELDAPDPARLLASTASRWKVGEEAAPSASGSFKALGRGSLPLDANLNLLATKDDDTEDTPPTAVPGPLGFDLDWEDEEEAAAGKTYDGAEVAPAEPAETFDEEELPPPDGEAGEVPEAEETQLMDDGALERLRSELARRQEASEASSTPAPAAAVGTPPAQVPGWLIAVAFFVLGVMVGHFLLP